MRGAEILRFTPHPPLRDVTLANMNYHLAHSNIAWMHGKINEPVMSGLAGRIDEINRLAEESRGFVWRISDTETSFAHLEVFREDFPGFDPERFFSATQRGCL